jgi:soluble lytic murein transglycosylase-like protein
MHTSGSAVYTGNSTNCIAAWPVPKEGDLTDLLRSSFSNFSYEMIYTDIKRMILARLLERFNDRQPGSASALAPGANTLLASSFDNLISQAANRYNVDQDLIRAVIKVESNFDPNAVSHAGAKGLMQLMDATADSLGVENSFDAAQNIEGGVAYLAQQLRRFHGNTELALAAYNAGPGAVMRHGGIPPIAETQKYVSRVLSYYKSSEDPIDYTV